jgi:hypothetical protein
MFKEINNCEICGVETGDDYLSDPRCNLHGFGVVLCTRCADRCDALDDAAFEKLADEKVASLKKATGDVESAVHETKARLERVGRDMIAARTDDANRYAKLLGRVVVVETRKEGQA